MGFDKTVTARIWGFTNQNSDVRMTAGDSSGGTFTGMVNPLKGTKLWDRCMYVLTGVSVAGGATGGSYTVTVETDNIAGVTGLPIARVSNIGPLSVRTQPMDSLHKSPCSPIPTHIFVDQTATGGGIWFQCRAIAKQYRGFLGTVGAQTSERILQGTMIRGISGVFADSRGFDEDSTLTLGTSGSDLGMKRMRLWDNVLYWAVAGNTVAGTHDVDVVATIGGSTVTIARTGTAGTITAAGSKTALQNLFYGQSPNPTHIIWTEVSAGGVSDGRVVMVAKSGRGSMAKT